MADSDALWLTLVGGLLFFVYIDHLMHAFWKWESERSIRSFRNLFIAIMLQIGFLRIWLQSSVRAFPEVRVLEIAQDITAPVLSLLLLSGGFVLAYTWRRDKKP